MKILGLTGSIGMGKSTASVLLRRMGVPVYDADAEVHRLFNQDRNTIRRIAMMFPGTVIDGRVDRLVLAVRVFNDLLALTKLESLLHPLVRAAENRFLRQASAARKRLVVLDIPLLLESGRTKYCDAIAVMIAPRFLQTIRVMRRAGMTNEKLAAIRCRQMPEKEKRRRADFLIPSGLGRRLTLRCLARVVKTLQETGDARNRSGYRNYGFKSCNR